MSPPGRTLLVLLILGACRDTRPAALGAQGAPTYRTAPLSQIELRTTDGAIALGNLQAQIDGERRLAADRPLTLKQRAGIVELIAMRGQFLGRVADYELAEAQADAMVRDAPSDGVALLARARKVYLSPVR